MILNNVSNFYQYSNLLSVKFCNSKKTPKILHELLRIITHGASEASGVRNFWHLSAKILYTVEPKTATSPCVHFEVAASPSLFPFRWHLVYRVMEVDHNIQRWTIWNFDNDRMKKFHKNLVVFGTLLLLLSDNFVATRRTSKG